MTAGFRSAFVGAATATALVSAAIVVIAASPDGERAPWLRFRQNLTEYAALKANVGRTVPPRSAARSFEAFVEASDRLRRALARARRDVRPGNIFAPESRRAFRDLIALTLAEHDIDVDALRVDLELDRPVRNPALRLNEPFPRDRRVLMVPCLLESLPLLPAGLEYRLDGRDLVLIDADVNLILDVLPRALGR